MDSDAVSELVVPLDVLRDEDVSSRLKYRFADEVGDAEVPDELVERLLTRGAMSVIYGDSNSGKTFLAIDLACAVAGGRKWMERHAEGGLVVYLAAESPASVRMRLRANQKHHGRCVVNFAIVQSPVDLFAGDADTEAVIALVKVLERKTGCRCELITGDTLARLSAGANENSGEDMGEVVRNIDRIRAECKTHFLLIHHCGKDQQRGMRGWSGLRAAADTEIEVTASAETGLHVMEVTKQRDVGGKGERIGFRLHVVELGVGKWDTKITSCVVEAADAPAKVAHGKRPPRLPARSSNC